jgi:hypothetical protein
VILRELARRMRALEANKHKPLLKAARVAVGAARAEAIKGFRATGIGRKLWGARGKGAGAALMVAYKPRPRWSKSQQKVVGGLETKGIPALIEHGGRTKPHAIRPKLAGALAGSLFHPVSGSINHPGSNVPKRPQLYPAMRKAAQRIAPYLDREAQAEVNATLEAGRG